MQPKFSCSLIGTRRRAQSPLTHVKFRLQHSDWRLLDDQAQEKRLQEFLVADLVGCEVLGDGGMLDDRAEAAPLAPRLHRERLDEVVGRLAAHPAVDQQHLPVHVRRRVAAQVGGEMCVLLSRDQPAQREDCGLR